MIKLKTHRCEKSLKVGVSIKYTKQFPSWNIKDDKETWRLYHTVSNEEDFGYHQSHVAEIEYCPFCNKYLYEENKELETIKDKILDEINGLAIDLSEDNIEEIKSKLQDLYYKY